MQLSYMTQVAGQYPHLQKSADENTIVQRNTDLILVFKKSEQIHFLSCTDSRSGITQLTG